MRILYGPVNMALMLKYLTPVPEMQGYVYAFGNILAMI